MIGAERRVLIAPDKFKGSLSAAEVAAALGSGLAEHQGVTWRALPLADGGDGSVQAAVDAGIEAGGLARFDGVELVAASDVENPLRGPPGAAAVYGPQKGATARDVATLGAGLAHLVRRLDDAGLAASSSAALPGAGSAGGLGFAAMVLGARLVSGSDFFLDLLGFDAAAARADLVVTGEGKLDEQTLSGKLPLAVARRARGVPVVAVVGHNALGRDSLAEHGIERVWALSGLSDRDTSADPRLSAELLRQLGHRIGHDLGAPSVRA